MCRTRGTTIITICAGKAKVTAFSQLKVNNRENDSAQGEIEHMISGKGEKRKQWEVTFTVKRKRKYVNIGCVHYMWCAELRTSQDISTGRQEEVIGDSGESNGEYVRILEWRGEIICLHFRQKGKYVNITCLHFRQKRKY